MSSYTGVHLTGTVVWHSFQGRRDGKLGQEETEKAHSGVLSTVGSREQKCQGSYTRRRIVKRTEKEGCDLRNNNLMKSG